MRIALSSGLSWDGSPWTVSLKFKNLHSRRGARSSIPGPDERVFPSPRPLTEKTKPRFYFSPNAPHLQKCTWLVHKEYTSFAPTKRLWELRGSLQAVQPLPSIKWQTRFISFMPQYPFICQGLRDHEHLKNNNRIEGSLPEALETPSASLGTGRYLGEKSEVRCQHGSEERELRHTQCGEAATAGFTKKQVRQAEKARCRLLSLPNHLRSIYWMQSLSNVHIFTY